ncbi:MAG: helix-turn-helix transcriptional regulator [Egibacteraceae bacterium]
MLVEGQREFGQAVASRRSELNLSQQELAAKICVDRTYISKIERGAAFPSRTVARTIAALGPAGAEAFIAAWEEVDRRRRLAVRPRGRAEAHTVATDFASFVGGEIARDGAALVYPVFQLSDEAAQSLSHLDQQLLYTKQHSPFTRTHRIDVPLAAAANDVRALLYVSELLQRYITVRTVVRTDAEVVSHCDCSFFSFGLSSNDCTHMYLETADHPLFEIIPDEHGLEYLELADGSEFHSTSREIYGIVARIHPDRMDHPDRAWFLCAGLGPQGTPGAAWYLATNWQSLHSQAKDADFLVVVRVSAYSDESAKFAHILIDRAAKQRSQ